MFSSPNEVAAADQREPGTLTSVERLVTAPQAAQFCYVRPQRTRFHD
jgi:hypothetical protein